MQVKIPTSDAMRLSALEVWVDDRARSPHEQMAIDEACFRLTREDQMPRVRFYRWSTPAVTIGYFDSYPIEEARPTIRRITGGGLVEHGNDFTFCLTLPSGIPASRAPTAARYHWIHSSLAEALLAQGIETRLEESSPLGSGPCFTAPVQWDLLDTGGQKIAGGAQRNSRGHVIHQGSVQNAFDPSILAGEWIPSFCDRLANHLTTPACQTIDEIILRSRKLGTRKYDNDSWNQKAKPPCKV